MGRRGVFVATVPAFFCLSALMPWSYGAVAGSLGVTPAPVVADESFGFDTLSANATFSEAGSSGAATTDKHAADAPGTIDEAAIVVINLIQRTFPRDVDRESVLDLAELAFTSADKSGKLAPPSEEAKQLIAKVPNAETFLALAPQRFPTTFNSEELLRRVNEMLPEIWGKRNE